MYSFEYEYDDANGIYTRHGPDGQTTLVHTDDAGRVVQVHRYTVDGQGQPDETVLFAEYDYYANGLVKQITYGNGAMVKHEYDDAQRLTLIRHLASENGPLVLKLEYAYNPRGLITEISESDDITWQATTLFDYDSRGRLIGERRLGDVDYWLTYEYDQGGNRTWKYQKNPDSGLVTARTQYRYDTEESEVDYLSQQQCDPRTTAECFKSRHNRLMYYKTEVWYDDGGHTTPGFRIAETVWYQYLADSAAVGSPDYIVRRIYNPANPGQPPVNYGYGLIYNTQGTLWFITQVQWTGATCPQQEEHEVISRHEFRSVGRAMRLTRVWDPDNFDLPKAGTNVWHDYDGDEIYADTLIDHEPEYTVTPLAAHEPGIGKVDYVCRNAQDEIVPCGSEGASEPEPMLSHYHGDQIGSTRAITGPGSAGVPPASIQGRIVYTAFGERVWSDGTVGTRYQYAGSWGYQSDLYEDAGANALPSSLFPAPFIHVGHRWYDPATGRFLQRDPIGIGGGLNVYAYLNNSSPNTVDPLGLDGPFACTRCREVACQCGPQPDPNFRPKTWMEWEEVNCWLDNVINGPPLGLTGSGTAAAGAANYKWKLSIGRQVNVTGVVCAGIYLGWNAGKNLDKALGLSDRIGKKLYDYWP